MVEDRYYKQCRWWGGLGIFYPFDSECLDRVRTLSLRMASDAGSGSFRNLKVAKLFPKWQWHSTKVCVSEADTC
jgi:hypothetical protein